ncbi:MAG TPA: DUF6766 family protein [Flavobacterium sp.]|jgi:hypothetical protein
MYKFFYNNGLSIVFLSMFIGSFVGQMCFGFHLYNSQLAEEGAQAVAWTEYLTSGHFVQSTFENWESEFLQMALYVWFTIFLRQKGSSESKKCEGTEDVDREPSAKRKGAPWPVKRGGIILKLYENSMTIALLILFVISFFLHFWGSLSDENFQLALKGKPPVSAMEYAGESRFWFESFQNWQSEFLSVFAIIVLSIYLRQKGSPQSKPVDASHDETGK